MRIKIDTREKIPYEFEDSEVGTVPVGDYSIPGLEDCVGIERKEINDLIGCLTKDRERFERELQRSKSLDFFCLILECSLSDIVNGRYRSEMEPKAAIQSLLAFSVRYRLPIFFCETREHGQRLTESLLEKYTKGIEKKHEAVSKLAERA